MVIPPMRSMRWYSANKNVFRAAPMKAASGAFELRTGSGELFLAGEPAVARGRRLYVLSG